MKKILSVSFGICLLFASLVTANAAWPCDNCGQGNIQSSTRTSAVVNKGQHYCCHGYPFGVDIIQEYTVHTTYKCSRCNYGWTSSQPITQEDCRGIWSK